MLYIDTIMPAVTKADPTRAYWPSSPSNGVGAWGNSQDPTRYVLSGARTRRTNPHNITQQLKTAQHHSLSTARTMLHKRTSNICLGEIHIIGACGTQTNRLQSTSLCSLDFAQSLDSNHCPDTLRYAKSFLL